MRSSAQRLEALERQLQKDQAAAEKRAFVDIGKTYAMAYYLGGAQSVEELPAGWARALEYQDINALNGALADAMSGKTNALAQRGYKAWARLFDRFGLRFDRCSPTAIRAELYKIVSGLPEHLVRSIKAAATARAREELEEANFNRWFDEIERAVERGEMERSEAVAKLTTGSELRKVRVFTRAISDTMNN